MIQEVEVRMLQDILRGLPPVPEKEILGDYQTYLEYVNNEIATQCNNYKYVSRTMRYAIQLCTFGDSEDQ